MDGSTISIGSWIKAIFQQRVFQWSKPEQTTGIGQDHAILGDDRSVSVIYSVAVEHLWPTAVQTT